MMLLLHRQAKIISGIQFVPLEEIPTYTELKHSTRKHWLPRLYPQITNNGVLLGVKHLAGSQYLQCYLRRRMVLL